MKYLILLFLLMFVFIYLATRPNEAEYQHCLVTSLDADESICESLKP